jgi:O-antigen/teichoic acid export membrane protein
MKGVTNTEMLQRIRSLANGNGFRAQLIRGGLGSGAVQATNRLLALALGIVLARMLGPDHYGVYAYAFAIMSLLMVVAEAGVPTLLMREVAASQGRSEWGLLRGALRRGIQFVALMATAVSLIGLLVLWWLADLLSADVLYTTGLMLLVLPVSALCKTVAHVMRGLHRVVIGQVVDMLIRPLFVLVIVALVFLAWPEQREPHVAMAAQLVGALLVLLIGLMLLQRFLPEPSRTSSPEYRNWQWIKSALPFTLIGGAGIINSQTDIIMLGWFMTTENVGLYRVAVQSAALLAFAQQAISVVISPQIAALHAKSDFQTLQKLVTEVSRILLIVVLICFVFFVLFAKDMIILLFGIDYLAAHPPFLILITAQAVTLGLFSLIGPVLAMMNCEKMMSALFLLASFFNVTLNLLLIPRYGTYGAAIATGLTMILLHGSLFAYSIHRLRINVLPISFCFRFLYYDK